MIGRRQLLLGLGAAACAPRVAALGDLPAALRLGWRLVPGQRWTYETRVEHRRPGRHSVRTERWDYRVIARDRGIATLGGRLVGLGGSARPSRPLATATALQQEREEGQSIALRLDTQGRFHEVAGTTTTACGDPSRASRSCFGSHLPHRLLALPLPSEPVQRGSTWQDPHLAALFGTLLEPDGAAPQGQTAPSHAASCTVVDLYRTEAGEPRVDLRSTLLVQDARGHRVRADGQTTWDPQSGSLVSRTLRATTAGGPGPSAGELSLVLNRIDEVERND